MTGFLLAAPLLAVPDQAAAVATRADTPVHSLQVIGEGVGTYPAYDPAIERYAVTTTAQTAGTLRVTATTSDPVGTVLVDGVVDSDGTATVTGLDEGDEVAVWIEDSAGLARYSFVYLPTGFPTLAANQTSDELAPGAVLLGLSNSWLRGLPGQPPGVPDYIETVVDRRGVPLHVESFPGLPRSMDFKRQPNGSYTVARSTTAPGRTGEVIIELDATFREVARHETVGLVNTDGHDAILLPDGTAWLMAYEKDRASGLIHSLIQRIDPDGSVGFEWSSAPYAAETVAAGPDYAHLNSFEVMADGDLLASFRNLSSIYKIATSARDGIAVGDVVWKLGGRDSDFTVTGPGGAPDGGPCAQHAATELPNGDIALFDNGSSDVFEALCLRPGALGDDAVQRVRTRALTLRLDEGSGTARIVRSYEPPGRFAWFAGSTQSVGDDGLLIGWASATAAIATELDAAGEPVWELRDTAADPSTRYFSYRALLAEVPDAIPPTVTWDAPPDEAALVEGAPVVAAYTCHDRGGSSLRTCTGSAASGAPVDTGSPGPVSVTVRATDGARSLTTETRTYEVHPRKQPDAWIKVGERRWVGRDAHGPAASQRVASRLARAGATRRIEIDIENDGATRDRFRFAVVGREPGLRVSGSRSGTTPRLEPGERWTLRLVVTRTRAARPGALLGLRVEVRSIGDTSRVDRVSARVVAVP